MTGYGRATAKCASRSVTVELKSLNSKQLDLQVRMPAEMRESELELRNEIAERVERGKVEATITEEMLSDVATATLDLNVISNYKRQLDTMSRECGLPEPADWYTVLLRMPDALKAAPVSYGPEEKSALLHATVEATEALCDFRQTEGRKLYKFFLEKIETLYALLDEIETYEKERVPKIKERLTDQLSRLDSIEYDSGRLEQELIFYIEKLDVTEEKIRLRAHLNYFIETMEGDDDVSAKGKGKKLGFIAQEMGREINTLGSKSNHAEMQKTVVRMKDELEQIKEQVLNVL